LLPAHGVTEVITPDTPPDDAARVGDLIGEHGLELVVLSHAAALGGSDEEALIAARRQIDHCVRLGVIGVLVDMGHPLSDSDDRYFQLTRGAADHAVITG
jgi:sugar phosphate isomerase/epimerase